MGKKVRFLEPHDDAPEFECDVYGFLALPDGSGWWSGLGDVYVHRTPEQAVRLVTDAIETERAEVLEEFRLLEAEKAHWEGVAPGGENCDVRVGQQTRPEQG
jgi:hypothetical protein